jgi:hypothetical protein
MFLRGDSVILILRNPRVTVKPWNFSTVLAVYMF